MFIIKLQYICKKIQIIFHWVKGNKIGSTRGPSTVLYYHSKNEKCRWKERERERRGTYFYLYLMSLQLTPFSQALAAMSRRGESVAIIYWLLGDSRVVMGWDKVSWRGESVAIIYWLLGDSRVVMEWDKVSSGEVRAWRLKRCQGM